VGESQNQPFQLSFNVSSRVDFQGSRVASDGRLVLIQELDERLAECDRIQSGQPVATARVSGENRRLIAGLLAAAAREGWRGTDRACQVVLNVAGRGASAPAPDRPKTAADLGPAGAEWVALRLRWQNQRPREEGRSSV
jgi:hypothetical protein